MKQIRWTTADLLDFTVLLHEDAVHAERGDEAALKKRDRMLYTRFKAEKLDNRALLRSWLEARRSEYAQETKGETVLPGQVFLELSRVISWAAFILGIIAGAATVLPFLSYSGAAPVNVTLYFAFFVVLQILIFFLQLIVLGIRFLRGLTLPDSLLVRFLVKVMKKALQRVAHNLPKMFAAKSGADAALLLWFGFLFIQLAAIGFNCGVIATTLVKVSLSDIAFGWQSTLQVQDGALLQSLQWIALPWSWFVPESIASPSLEAITGSRMVLKDGLYHLATADLVAWWPFLCFSVATYGLLPRLLLLIFGIFQKKQLLNRLPSLNVVEVRMLLRRMTAPIVQTAGEQQYEKSDADVVEETRPQTTGEIEPAASGEEALTLEPEAKIFCLVPDELFDDYPLPELVQKAMPDLAPDAAVFLRVRELDENEDLWVAELKQKAAEAADCLILLIQEGWQPPIEEDIYLLEQIDQATEHHPISLCLLGKPKPDVLLTPVREKDLEIWKTKLRKSGKAYVDIRTIRA